MPPEQENPAVIRLFIRSVLDSTVVISKINVSIIVAKHNVNLLKRLVILFPILINMI
jgi:hypothetical protein